MAPCDKGTIAVLEGKRREYGLGIVKVAELRTGHRPLSSMSLLETKSQMKRSVMRILDLNRRIDRHLSSTAIFTAIMLGAILIPGNAWSRHTLRHPNVANDLDSLPFESHTDNRNFSGGQQGTENMPIQQAATPQESPKSIQIQITDLNDRPLPGAKIVASNSTNILKALGSNKTYTCVENGEVEIELLPNVQLVRLWAIQPGYVTLFASWEEDSIAKLPKKFVFRMQPGIQIGGVVLDSNGKAISGAKVEVSFSGKGTKLDGSKETSFSPWLAHGDKEPDPAQITDDDGRWSLTNVPPGDDVKFSFHLIHPDFVSDAKWHTEAEYEITSEELRQQSAKFRLNSGVRANGTITDPDGKAVVGALIIWGDRPATWQTGRQDSTTDVNGRFQIPPQPNSEINVTVIAKGWMPEIRKVEFHPDMPPIDFQLKAGKKLNLKFVDVNGKPVPGINVQIVDWHGVRSLYNVCPPIVTDPQIPSTANDQGEFVWDWAPDDAVSYMIGKPNAAKYIEQSLVADGEIKIITISPVSTLSGTVTDSQTGKSISNFTVVPIAFGLSGGGLAQPPRKSFTTSQFTLDQSSLDDTRDIEFQFEAIGYRTKRSGRFSASSAPPNLDIRLDPAPIQHGRVVDTAGNPCPRVRVNLATPDFWLDIDSIEYMRDGNFYLTDENGVFQYPAQISSAALIVDDVKGYAEKYVELDKTPGDLVLEPWAKVEGQLFQAGQPVVGASMFLTPIRPLGGEYPVVHQTFRETTDDTGRFVFSRVPPVPCIVSSDLSPWQDYPITSNQILPLDLKPGETRNVKLGGAGIAISGKVKLLGKGADTIQFRYGINLLVHLAAGIDLPASITNSNFDWRTGRIEDWLNSTEGKVYLSTLDHYFVKLNPDGSFFINGVGPGDYRFLLQIYEPPTGCLVDPVGTKVVEFSVDATDVEGGSLDLGNIELNISAVPKVGDAFPNFSFQILDGTKRRLDEYRGKYVILDFWATWCAPCVQTLPKIAELNKSLEKNSNVALLSVSLDKELATTKAFVEKQKLEWDHGFIGNVDSLAMRQLLGIGSVPLYYLVDPDGKIVFRSYDFEELNKQLLTEFDNE